MYTFKKSGTNVEIYQDGKRISTGTPDYAKSFGYGGTDTQASVTPPAPVAPQVFAPQTNTPQAPTAAPQPTPGNNLVTFKDTLNQALQIAGQKRNYLASQIAAPLRGKVDANSFSSILDSLNSASNNFVSGQFKQTVSDYLSPKETKLDTSVVEIGGRKVLINNQTGATVKDLGSSVVPGSGDGLYTQKQLQAITKVNEAVSKSDIYKKTSSMRTYGDNVNASLDLATGVADIAAINQFQKVIDEGAVTRDQDVQLIQSSQSLLNTLKSKISRIEKGEQLSPELRSQMKQAVNTLYAAQVKALNQDPYIKAKKKEVEQYGLGADDTILSELGGFQTAPVNSPSKSGTVRMTGPKGTFDVPANQVEVFKKNGYK